MHDTTPPTLLIVPGLRDHVPQHWQTLLQAATPGARSVPPLAENGLSVAARVAAIDRALAEIDGPVILVAHSAGVLMVVHWAARHTRPILGALLVTPPDLEASWPAGYPQPDTLREHGWSPLPRTRLPFPSIVAASSNDHLACLDGVQRMAADWGSQVVELGAVGHLNPAAGYGPWPRAEALIAQVQTLAASVVK
jgi:uncharacterized protein